MEASAAAFCPSLGHRFPAVKAGILAMVAATQAATG